MQKTPACLTYMTADVLKGNNQAICATHMTQLERQSTISIIKRWQCAMQLVHSMVQLLWPVMNPTDARGYADGKTPSCINEVGKRKHLLPVSVKTAGNDMIYYMQAITELTLAHSPLRLYPNNSTLAHFIHQLQLDSQSRPNCQT